VPTWRKPVLLITYLARRVLAPSFVGQIVLFLWQAGKLEPVRPPGESRLQKKTSTPAWPATPDRLPAIVQFKSLSPLLWDRHDVRLGALRETLYSYDPASSQFSKKVTFGQRGWNRLIEIYAA
jgi:hypothetical protein